jgi:hypothetical protein
VVQVGGRTPEPIPEVNEAGKVTGWRQDSEGKALTTALSAAGEEQLAKIAQVSGGQIVRSAGGRTGIEVVASQLRRLMTEELSERVETVYAEVYYYPLALAALLLVIEIFINEIKPREKPAVLPPPEPRKRRRRRPTSAAGLAAGLFVALSVAVACSRDRSSIFERRAPEVEQAIAMLDADAGSAVSLLESYLSTGKCDHGEIGTPEKVRERPNASFDLGLGLFRIGERFGQRFGEEAPVHDGGPTDQEKSLAEQRGAEVDCALKIVRLVAADPTGAPEFRARALYLAGNLEFLRGDYRTAVKSYDSALKVLPGLPPDAGDTIGNDAAHNRAIALRRIEEEDNKKDAGPPDAGPPDGGSPDSGEPDAGPQDGGQPDSGKDDGGSQDAGPDGGDQDAGPDGGNDSKEPDAGEDGGAPPPQPQPQPSAQPNANQDEAILDQLEQAPTVQEQDAKNRALKAHATGMEDK